MLPAFLAAKRPDVSCTGIDISETMLDIARKKVPGANILKADATDMPFGDSSFDVVTSCFVYRNLSDRKKAVSEMYRVLKPGGRVMLLDTFAPRSRSMMRPLMSLWLRRIVPALVSPFAKASDYRYLAESILAMTDRDEIRKAFEGAGFADVCLVALEFDTACVLTGRRDRP
ncbi:MAG: class I SAM-dependent methyltransferase [Planctomycetota bacterium]|nr:class I SAM-dependent methyltransferase [Planctomycetota bacterium]